MKTILLISLAIAAAAAAPRTPPPGTAERKAILDAVRPAVEAKVGDGVEFVVTRLLVDGSHAFAQLEPQRRDGVRINGAARFGSDWEYMDGLTTTAVLRYRNNRWTIVDVAIGATDVWWCDGRPETKFAC